MCMCFMWRCCRVHPLNRFLFYCVFTGYDVFIDLEEEGTSPDDTKSLLTNNDGLSKKAISYTIYVSACLFAT